MQMVIIDDFQVGRYDQARKGFPMAGLRLELDGVPAQFPIPDFLPMDEAAAEQALRQLGDSRRFQIAATITLTPVSYTHLDVYKRQHRVISRNNVK